MYQIGVVTTQSTLEETPSFSKITGTESMLLWIGLHVTPRFGTFASRPHHLLKASALELALQIRYNCKAERKCFAMAYNTVHLIYK